MTGMMTKLRDANLLCTCMFALKPHTAAFKFTIVCACESAV